MSGSNICVVAPQPFYQDRGTPIALLQVLRAYSELGHTVHLLTYPIGEDVAVPNVRVTRGPNPLNLSHVPIGFSSRKVLLDAALAGVARRSFKAEDFDLIHAVEEAVFLALAFRPTRVPVLYDMQSCLSEQLASRAWGRAPLFRRIICSLEQRALRAVDLVMCSAGLGTYARRFAKTGAVREWRYPPFQSQSLDDTLRRSRGNGFMSVGDVRWVVYAGNDAPYQGVDLLLDAAAKVCGERADARFLLVGVEEQRWVNGKGGLAKLVEDGRIVFVERQPYDQIRDYLNAAAVLVSPRKYGSNMPLKIIDYLNTGKRIVATDIAAHASVRDNRSVLFVEPNGFALASGILSGLDSASTATSVKHSSASWSNFVLELDESLRGLPLDAHAA